MVTFFAASLLACGTAAAAENADRPLCDFVKKVLAAKVTEFNTLKGEARNPRVFHNEVFWGTLLPAQGSECTLFIRTKVGRAELDPKYSCTLGSANDFAAANRMFQRNVADLRACYGQARFMDDYDGDGRDPTEPVSWNVILEGPDFRLELQMSNQVALVAQTMGQGSTDMPQIEITLDVTDTSPPKTPI
jgi:hypothetical protein|nr:MetaGeneMark_Unknown Function [uncultured bacterium]